VRPYEVPAREQFLKFEAFQFEKEKKAERLCFDLSGLSSHSTGKLKNDSKN